MKPAGAKAYRVALMGLLFALAVVLSLVESALPSFVPLPGIKLGLSNVVTMYCVFLLGSRHGFALAVLKSLFALLVRGWTAGVLSFCGGVLSVAAMLLVLRIWDKRASYAAVSVTGAVSHNVGQLAAAAVILRLDQVFFYYLPLLVGAGIVVGIITAVLLRAVFAYLPVQRKDGHR